MVSTSQLKELKTEIIFVQLPIWGVGVPPLGASILKSYLRENGVGAKVFDLNIHAYSIRGERYDSYWDVKNGWNHVSSEEKMVEFYKNYRALFSYYIDRIESIKPLIVGLTVYYSNMIVSRIFAEELKRRCPSVKVVFGGPNVAEDNRNSLELLASGSVDAICLGEGEKAVLAYYREVVEPTGQRLAGIVYKKDGEIIQAGPLDYIKKLDDIPFPDFDDFNLSLYFMGSQTFLPSYVSRGCPNKCIYCTERSFMKLFRYRSARRLAEEFEYLHKRYPSVKGVRLCDSIANANVRMLEEFCDLKIERKIPLVWSMENATVRKEMRAPVYKKLKKAGCILIGYGLETPSERLLKLIGKTLCLGVDVEKVLKEGKRAGIHISVNIMFGIPGETDEDFDYLLRFLKKNRRSLNMVNPSLNLCAFYPGSIGYNEPEKFGIDTTLGPDFWRTKDNVNTFPVRMERFERFVAEAKRNRLDNFLNTTEIPNKHQLLFEYYCAVKDKEKASEHYNMLGEATEEQKVLYERLVSGDQCGQGSRPVADYLRSLGERDGGEAAVRKSLGWLITSFERRETFTDTRWASEVHPIKYRLRKLAHRIIGVHILEKRINGFIELLKLAQRVD